VWTQRDAFLDEDVSGVTARAHAREPSRKCCSLAGDRFVFVQVSDERLTRRRIQRKPLDGAECFVPGSLLEENTSAPASADSLKILRLPQVCEVTGLCRSMIYQMEAELRFPRRIKIGIRAFGWREKEVNAWLVRRIAASRRSDGSLDLTDAIELGLARDRLRRQQEKDLCAPA
jgi:prophage regulatory protein